MTDLAEHGDEPLPPPNEPMAVARAIVAALYADDARLLLRSRSGDFYRWDGRCWPEAESRGIRGAVYAFLEHATYANKDGIPVPWAPTRRKVDDVLDALRAVVHLDVVV